MLVMRAATTHDLGAACRAERARRNTTQAELAARTATTRQWINGFERGRPRVETDIALRVLATLDITIETTATTPWTRSRPLTAANGARFIRSELDRGDIIFAFRLLSRTVADVRSITDPDTHAIATAPPPSTGDHRWDTLLAAAFAREANLAGRPVPDWTNTPPLDEPWFPDPNPMLTDRQIAATPLELADRNIYFDERGLESL